MRQVADKIGVIGGSGIYEIEGLNNPQWTRVETPWGSPSDEFLQGDLHGRTVYFLPRHGRGHRILPTELNHRANIWAMKSLGVSWILSCSAVGSLQQQYQPTDIVLINQFLDRTKRSMEHSFFGQGIVAHIAFSHPICEELRSVIRNAAASIDIPFHDGGTYVNMEGPAFSTLAESQANHQAGFDVIGMTNLGEAKCAREAEIAYATLALVTDYDCWKEEEEAVTVEMVIANLRKNADSAKKVLSAAIQQIPRTPTYQSHRALENAIMTQRELWPQEKIKALGPILEPYL